MIAHVGPVPVEELLALGLGSVTALTVLGAWLRASASTMRRGRRRPR